MELTPIEILTGTFSLIIFLVSVIIGLTIASKYFKYKQRKLLIVGFVWIGMVLAWLASGISFLYTLLTGEIIAIEIVFLIGITSAPIVLFLWMIVVTDLIYKKRQKVILLIIAIYSVVFEIFFFYFIFTDPSMIGELHRRPPDMKYKGLLQIGLVIILLIALITGIVFARESMKSEDPEIRLKGRFLLMAFISYSIGGMLDTVITTNVIAILITRIILISSCIEFYCGFILPKWIKRHFLKQE